MNAPQPQGQHSRLVPGGKPCVLQVLPSLNMGGVERGTIDIAQALKAAGGTPLVASSGGDMSYELARAGIEHIVMPLASKNPLVMKRNTQRLVQVIREKGVDIVHARSRAPAWSARAAARKCNKHFVTTFHGTYNFNNPVKKAYNAIMTKGERVIAISHFIADHIRENYEVDPARIRVIHRGVDLGKFDPALVSQERIIHLATKWRLPDGVPFIFMPGRLTRWKGQALLLDALSRITGRDFCCAFVGADQGRSAYKKELEGIIAAKGLADRAFIIDGCDDMPAAYMLADVVVSASTDPEAFGRVVSEGQAMGRPVVLSRHGGAPEQIIENLTGFSFSSGDGEGLAKCLERALDLKEDERAALTAAAIENVRANFSKTRMAEATLGLYRELLRGDDYAALTS